MKKNKTCHYCGSHDREMTKDHVTPKAHGGKQKVDCCLICNRAKGCMTHEEFIEWAMDIVRIGGSKL
jgi:5-methylcytosine-specific restriction endonuclease McrA